MGDCSMVAFTANVLMLIGDMAYSVVYVTAMFIPLTQVIRALEKKTDQPASGRYGLHRPRFASLAERGNDSMRNA